MEYSVYYMSGDKKSVEFFNRLRVFNDRLEKLAVFTPHLSCRVCDAETPNAIYNEGKYYCPPITAASSPSRYNPLQAGLEELCIHEEYRGLDNGKKWWDYMAAMRDCTGRHFEKSCVVQAQEAADIDMTRLAGCISNAKTKLPTEYDRFKDARIEVNPGVIISNKVYRVIPRFTL